jgi:DNA-binding IclR family transcriptional regulator
MISPSSRDIKCKVLYIPTGGYGMREINARTNGIAGKTLELFDLLAANIDGMSVSEISEALDITRATVYSLIRTCQDRGYVVRDPKTGLFCLGNKFYECGLKYQLRFPFTYVGGMMSRKVSNGSNVRAVIYVREGDKAVLMVSNDRPSGERPRWICSFPLWAGAPGRILLSALSENELDAVLRQERGPVTGKTVTDEQSLRERLSNARRQGFCVDIGEVEQDSALLAAPRYDREGGLVASFCFQIPTREWNGRGEELLEVVKSAARDISNDMGYRMLPG